MKTLIALAAAIVVASSLPSFGQSVTWNFNSSSSLTSTGGTVNFTSGGVKVTASAWSYTKGSPNSALEAAQLGQYGSAGLGVTNNEEGTGSPWHQVDNRGQNEYILFVFDTLVNVSNVKIQGYDGPWDQDVSYWVGNINSSNLDGVTYTGLSSLFGNEQVVSGDITSSAKNVAINSPSSGINAILFGPQRGLEDDATTDAFKIQAMTVTKVTVVPEPSAALLSILGALGFCIRRRR